MFAYGESLKKRSWTRKKLTFGGGDSGGNKLTFCVKQAGKALLKSDYVEGASMEASLKLAVKVLNKTMDSTTPTPEKMEFTTITRVNGKAS